MTKPHIYLGDYIDGEFIKPDKEDCAWRVHSPADLKELVFEVGGSFEHIERACLAARAAYTKWAHTSPAERYSCLWRLKEVLAAHKEPLSELISRETGKSLWDSQSEVAAMVNKVDITLNHSMKLVGEERIQNALPNVDGYIRHKPRGVMAVIGPFNFPGHLPMGHIIPALACGNTIVFKPSDKTPAVGQMLAEIIQKAEFPRGVFNLVQGLGESGKRLCGSEYVDGVLFTGSYEVGLKIKQETLQHHWKLLALEMGGKNATVVWEDADIKKAVFETIVGAFLSTGQRCSCTSRIVLHEKIRDKFVENFYQTAKKLTVGYWRENPFMGPLISAEAQEKYLRFQEIAKREGAEPLMRGKALNLEREGYYVTPSINLVGKFDPKSVYQKSEIFGPNVAIYTINDFDEAIAINNSSGFGLCMSLFSKQRSLYERALIDARVGILNWNRTTNRASSRLPFGGMGKSGNDRPSAHFAVYYCTVPVASLEDTGGFDEGATVPGMTFEYKE